MAKIYEYNGYHYCDEDLSEDDSKYNGDTYDLYYELRAEGRCREITTYEANGHVYDDYEELMEKEFGHLAIGEIDYGNVE